MANSTFLEHLAARLIDNHPDDISEIIIILPNKRAKVFLIEALKKQLHNTIFAPRIIAIEDFIQDIAGVRAADNIQLLFEFYDVYLQVTETSKQQNFELFANWAKMLLQDFNEIDRYLRNPDHVLDYLRDIEEIKHWSLELETKTELFQNHLHFWETLPILYHALYKHLLQKGSGYQGLIYREAVANLDHFSETIGNSKYYFAGFNALSAAEEKIIQHLIAIGSAEIIWDIDRVFLEDSLHDAGLFIRRFYQNWSFYKSNKLEWIANDFAQPKNIQIIGTPKSVGQAKIAGHIIDKILEQNPNANLDKVAIVLGQESLLVPLLHALPSAVSALNITMGYPAKNNPAQILVTKLFKMHAAALKRNANEPVFYYKDILDVLTHPLVEPYSNVRNVVQSINNNNYTFITRKRLLEFNSDPTPLFSLIFSEWNHGALSVLEIVSKILLLLKSELGVENQEKVAKAFIYAIFKVVNKLKSYFSQNVYGDDLDTLFAIYKQIIELAEVSFEGEPLNGLQIMGVLESRVLDFETVIITSMNEGTFPAGKSQNSFIPYDVKREQNLPTFKEKDAIYTYHFYHLLQRAKNVFLLYNTESDGLDAGEKSRFLTQLEVEKQDAHNLTHEIQNPDVPAVASVPIEIVKSEMVMNRLREIAAKNFSPSALTSYIRNPLDFYFSKILQIREVDEVEENIALNTLGTIIHESLYELYLPYVGKQLTIHDIEQCLKVMDDVVLSQFKKIYKGREIRKGRNLLAFEVAKRNVFNFLKMENEALHNGDNVAVLHLEQSVSRILEHPNLPFPIKIGGSVDRVEDRNGTIRIIDYKTGKVNATDLVLKNWEGLTADLKSDKIIQILAYAFVLFPEYEGRKIEAGIISFKNMKARFMPFTFKQDKEVNTLISEEIIADYISELIVLLNEILDQNQPFIEKVV